MKFQIIWMSEEIINGDTIKTKHEYGFTIGGPSEEEGEKANTISYWNNSDKIYRFVVTCDMIDSFPVLWQEEENLRYYLFSNYMQYADGNLEYHQVPGSYYGFYYVRLLDVQRLNSRKFDALFTSDEMDTTYTVVGHYILTKNFDRCTNCYY